MLPFQCLEYIVVCLGSTTSTLLVIVFPALFYIKLHGIMATDARGNRTSCGVGRFVACLLLVLGGICFLCLIGSILHWME